MILAETASQTEVGAAITVLPVIAAPVDWFQREEAPRDGEPARGLMKVRGVAWMRENESMRIDLETQHCYGLRTDHLKIMAQASVLLPGEPSRSVEIRRGMVLTSIDGKEAGKVAGVVVSPDSRQVQYLILSHLPREANYQCIPVSWIERIQGEVISLNMRLETILALPDWHAS